MNPYLLGNPNMQRGIDHDLKKKICIGAVSHRVLQADRPEDVAGEIRKALRYIPPERLIVSSDCGFGRQGCNREIAFYKASAIAQGCNIVRRELGSAPTYVPAADPVLQIDVVPGGKCAVFPESECVEAERPPQGWSHPPPERNSELAGLRSLRRLRDLRCVAADCRVARVWYKDEATRFGIGSFKALGGAYAVFRVLQEARGPVTVTTATDGNHGRAVAWGAQMFGCRAVIFIPKSCSVERERAIARLGAEVVRTSLGYDDTVRECARVAQAEGYQVVSDTSWSGYTEIPRMVMQGYTVMVQEAIEQMTPEKATHIFVQAGVGGLAAAVCAYMWEAFGRERPKFVVVEPEGAAGLFASAQAGEFGRSGAGPTIMACLECAEPSPLAWEVLSIGRGCISYDSGRSCRPVYAIAQSRRSGGNCGRICDCRPGWIDLRGQLTRSCGKLYG